MQFCLNQNMYVMENGSETKKIGELRNRQTEDQEYTQMVAVKREGVDLGTNIECKSENIVQSSAE